MKFFKVLNSKVPQSSSSIYHNLFARIWEGFWVMKFIIGHIVLFAIIFVYWIILKLFKALVYVCVSKLISACVCFKVLPTNCVSQSSYLLLSMSKLLPTNVCFKSFYFPLSVYMNFGRFMSFEVHHKHGLFYHIIFAKVYFEGYEFSSSSKFIFCVPQFICMKFGSF